MGIVDAFRISQLTLVDVGKVSAEAVDRVEHGGPVDQPNELQRPIVVVEVFCKTSLIPSIEIQFLLNPFPIHRNRQALLFIKRNNKRILAYTPIRSIQRLHRLGVEILHSLLITPADTVLGPALSIKGVNGLGDAQPCRFVSTSDTFWGTVADSNEGAASEFHDPQNFALMDAICCGIHHVLSQHQSNLVRTCAAKISGLA